MGLADIVKAKKPTPIPRETRLADEKVELEASVGSAYSALVDGAEFAGAGKMDGDVLVYPTQIDLAAELQEWVVSAGIKCGLTWEGEDHPVLHVSVLAVPDPVVVEPLPEAPVEGGA